MAPKRKRKGQTLDPPSDEINLNNQFDLLTDDENDPSSKKNSSKLSRLNAKKEKIPPIVITTTDFHALRMELLNFVKVKFSLQIGRRGECRVLAETLDGFKCLLKYLTEKKHNFFTYDTKTERVFKVVMKGLPSGESLDQIKDELAKLLGVVPLQVIKMKMKSRPGDSRNGISNDFYLVHFKSSELNNLKALEKASLMLHVRVKWEHFRKTGGNFQNLTQCRKCQGWGHGTKNCYMPAKCMNCGDSSHAKDDCPVKEDPKKFKCSNCGENHKSNFWECKTRKAILQSRSNRQVGNAPRFRPGTNSSAVNNGQRGTNSTFVPVGTNISPASNVSSVPSPLAANNVQRVNGATYAAIAAGRNQNTNQRSNGNFDNFDLGSITAPKMEFLQNSLIDMISDMLKSNSMFDAIQTGVKFANNIVMTLKFSNGF
ncbi:uncharacterized protein LOC135699745 [Ochlerotatus camptorhynchus]|uniref:uncharacterized protein LOC135699745 n=1 Tax=Ochlerotatus camptorhynchus TaxID=644619 RepID=UPI0031D7DE81